ncbi:MAG: ketoacyl-ACP synthase III [Saprospiraceae bacterium]|nr:ketoacyl-ACP synthase III [Saprospiraceae bacterium]MDW8484210.1 beta-ketoacyl-ACP synthase III [Saprospiraceae bacterium]
MPNKLRAAITGVNGWVPEDRLTNADLEKMVDTSDEWITTRTGIKERRILRTPGWATSDMAAEAVRGLITKTGISPGEIDLLIVATVTADMVFPDTANTVCDKVGAKNAFGFDINAACSGFLYALTTGAQFIVSGAYEKVVVVGADMMSSIVDYTDRNTCVLFGDGAGAVLLEGRRDGTGIHDFVLRGDGSGREYLHMKAGGSLRPPSFETIARREHYVYQEGKRVFKFAVEGMVSTAKEILRRNHKTPEEIDWVVPHQANMRIIASVAEHLGIPMEKVMVNIHKYGNTTAATIPLCLWEYEDRLKKDDDLILTAFGGGFTWGSVYLKWSY